MILMLMRTLTRELPSASVISRLSTKASYMIPATTRIIRRALACGDSPAGSEDATSWTTRIPMLLQMTAQTLQMVCEALMGRALVNGGPSLGHHQHDQLMAFHHGHEHPPFLLTPMKTAILRWKSLMYHQGQQQVSPLCSKTKPPHLSDANSFIGPSDAPPTALSRSQSPAGVVTPPESPPAPASAADVEMEVDLEDAGAAEQKAKAKEEGEAERDTENVKDEVRTEVAKDE